MANRKTETALVVKIFLLSASTYAASAIVTAKTHFLRTPGTLLKVPSPARLFDFFDLLEPFVLQQKLLVMSIPQRYTLTPFLIAHSSSTA